MFQVTGVKRDIRVQLSREPSRDVSLRPPAELSIRTREIGRRTVPFVDTSYSINFLKR